MARTSFVPQTQDHRNDNFIITKASGKECLFSFNPHPCPVLGAVSGIGILCQSGAPLPQRMVAVFTRYFIAFAHFDGGYLFFGALRGAALFAAE